MNLYMSTFDIYSTTLLLILAAKTSYSLVIIYNDV